MQATQRWRQAQETEHAFWVGMAQSETGLLRVLADNAELSWQIRRMLQGAPHISLEIGIGPLGVGVTGFMPEIPVRIGLDPIKRVQPDCAQPLRDFILARRAPIRYVVACGESIPLATASVDLVVCCNVLDHVRDPDAILAEVARVLKPSGYLYLEVHTFSVLGLLKWHGWTKRRHRDQILVKAHPYRFFEWTVDAKLRAAGLRPVRKEGHSLLSLCAGHAIGSAWMAANEAGSANGKARRKSTD